jgi:hypothetical protein
MLRLPIAMAVGLALLLPGTADAASSRCKTTGLHYAFAKGQPKFFGVFRLRVTGGSCKTAHRVAKQWMDRFEDSIRGEGKLVVPKRVEGFTFETLKAVEAQSYNERGRKGDTTIRFLYRVPNG